MEILGLVDVPLYLLLCLAVTVLIYIYGTWNYNYFKKQRIPGPEPTCCIGNTGPNLGHNLYKWSKRYGTVFGIFLGRTPAYVIADLEILKEVMVKSFDNFRNRRIVSVPYPVNFALGFLEDAAWKRVRNTITPSFTAVKLRRMCGAINDCARTLTTNFSEVMGKNAGVNVKERFGAFSMDVICQTAFGIKVDSQNDFNHPFVVHAKTIFRPTKLALAFSLLSAAVPALEPVFNKLGFGIFPRKPVAFFETITGEMMKQRRKDKTHHQEGTDFLQVMMDTSMEEGKDDNNADGQTVKHSVRHLSTEEIVAQCITFFVAGYETTASTLTFISYNLAMNPGVQEKAYREIKDILGNEEPNYENIGKLKYLDNVITETLRLYPPGFVNDRTVSETTQIKGLTFSKGQSIFIPVMAIHRNPQVYEDPDSFKPERFEDQDKTIAFQSFGFGPRACIGMRLALVELKVAFVNVLRAVKFDRVPDTPMYGSINDCGRTLTTNFSKVIGENRGINVKDYFGGFSMDEICQTALRIKVDSQTDFNHPFVVHAQKFFRPTKVAQAFSVLSGAVPALEPIIAKLGLGIFSRETVDFFETITGELMKQRRNDNTHHQQGTDFLKMLMDASIEKGKDDNANDQTVKHSVRIDRTVSETTQIQGLTFSKGQNIFIPVMAIHRNPELYEDPDSFKPERYEDQDKTIAFQAFGFGPGVCIGMRLALVELKVALINVLRAVKFDRMPDTPKVLTFAKNPNVLQADKDIILKVSPRS